MKKKDRKFKTFTKWLCSMLTLAMLVSIMPMTFANENTRASHSATVEVEPVSGWSYAGTQWGDAGHIKLNGEISYCLERTVELKGGIKYAGVEEDFSPAGISQAKKEKLSLLAYFGKQRAISTGKDEWYAMAQNAIWYELDGKLNGWEETPTFNSKTKVMDAIQQLNDDVDKYEKVPSFEGQTFDIKVGETIRLTDKNKVLSTFKVSATGGLNVKIEGNDLVITGTASADESATISFIKNILASDTGVSILWQSGNLQKIGTFKVGDPNGGNVKINVEKYGSLKIAKKDNKGNFVPNTTFKLSYNADMTDPIGTYTTGNDGTVNVNDLLPQTVYVQETAVPSHLVLDSAVKSVAIEPSKTVSFTATNNWKLGQINLTKEDSETGNKPQGDGTLEGAEYVLKANSHIPNPVNGSILYVKDEIISVKNVGNGTIGDVGTKTTNKDAKITWTNLPMGEYRIEEKTPPTGYLPDSDHIVQLTSTDQSLVVKEVTSKEKAIKGRLEILKIGTDGETGGVVPGLKDVEFTMKLYSEVKEVGWDNAKVYSKFVTNEYGRGFSDDVPIGVYLVKETQTPLNYEAGGDFFVNIDIDKEVEFRAVNNIPFKAWLKIVKVDDEGQSVSLSNTTFKLKDPEGNYVKQKVGMEYKDEWTTNDKGYVALDKMLLFGEYTLEELRSPDGFLIGDDIKVNISVENDDIVLDQDDEPVITVKFINKKPTGTILLHKQFERAEDIIQGGAKFRLIANSDVLDPATGKIIYQKGNIVNLKGASDGIYSIDENGNLEIKDIPLGVTGASYLLEEVETLDGYSLLEEPIVFDFKITDNTTKEYVVEKSVENKLTETLFSKVDVAGKELPGAQLSLKDKDGNIIDEWTSTKEAHLVKGLIYGQEYTLVENLAPLGYNLANDITFTYSKDIEKITMVDEAILTDIQVNKVDSQTMLPIVSKDFEFTMYSDEACTHVLDVVHADLEDGTATFKDMHFGTVYIKETKAPLGYKLSNEVKKIVIDDELEGVGEVHSFVYLNTLMPVTVIKTGDATPVYTLIGLTAVSIAGLSAIYLSGKRKKDE